MALGFQTSEQDALSRLRIRYVQALLILGIAGSLWGIASTVLQPELIAEAERAFALAASVSFAIVSLGLLLHIRRSRQIALATWVILASLVLSAVGFSTGFLLVSLIAVTTAAVLGGWPMFLLVNGIILGKGVHDLVQLSNSGLPVSDAVYNLIAITIVSFTTRFFIHTAEQAGSSARRTTDLLQAAAEIGEITGKLLDLDTMLPQAVNLIRDRFAFYHAQIFLIDEKHEYASLVASTGEAGKRLLERKHRLAVGSQSVIGRVTQIGEPVIAYSQDSVHARNELLPDTASELALPIMDGDQVIGALDVQSTRRNAFGQVDIQALQVMANQLGISIRNARLFAEQTASLQENKRLFFESEANLREIQRLNQQLTKAAWDSYLQGRRGTAGITLGAGGAAREDTWSSAMLEASQRRRPVTQAEDGEKAVAVPILLRGELLGALEIEGADDMQEKEVAEMLQAIAQRLALSLDRARLFEEAQESSTQQQQINEIVGQYQAAGTIDDLLQITLNELSATFGAQRAAIRLGGTPKPQPQNGAKA